MAEQNSKHFQFIETQIFTTGNSIFHFFAFTKKNLMFTSTCYIDLKPIDVQTPTHNPMRSTDLAQNGIFFF